MVNYIRESSITVTFQKPGIHCYPAAKDMPGVEFLANPHRHMFHFVVTVQVEQHDREIEFLLFKRELEGLYAAGTLQLDSLSCEMLADALANYIINKYPGRKVTVTVFEDGENGGSVSYIPVKGEDA